MRNALKYNEKQADIGSEAGKSMRNAIPEKYFSQSIYLIDYALSEINENMRNENKKTLVLRQIPCFFMC